ncbi:MAG: type II secretion system protein [Syntrophales bacterium]|nr:type II secretion system protein [Syntrophales bacterium]
MKRICKTHIHQRGFTMIEMVIVLIVMAIVATFILARATPGSNDLIAQAEILKSHLRYAQIRAMNDTVSWGIHIPDDGSYVLYKNNVPATALLPGETAQTHTLPTGITVTDGVGSTYNFDDWGSLVTPKLTITLSQGTTTTSNITITKNTGYIP